MKNKFLIILMSFSVMVAFCQNETFTKKFTRTKVLKIDFSKIYYKKTGEKIKENEFVKLVKNNPNLQIENIIGIDGEIEKLATITLEVHKEYIDLGKMFTNFLIHVTHSSIILQGKLHIMKI